MKGSLFDHDLEISMHEGLCSGDEDEQDLEGICFTTIKHGTVAIKLDSDIRGKGAANTLIHELIHGVDHVSGLGLPHQVVYVLASGLTQALTSLDLLDEHKLEAALRKRLKVQKKKT